MCIAVTPIAIWGCGGTPVDVVRYGPPASLEISPAGADVLVGESATLSTVVRDANGLRITPSIGWRALNPEIAEINASGRVTGRRCGLGRVVATAGSAVDTARVGVSILPSVPATERYASVTGVQISTMTRRSDNLFIQDIALGSGAALTGSPLIRVRYTTRLTDGTVVDSNLLDGLQYRYGAGLVITGFDQGLFGMRAGGRRRLVVGSSLAYGSQDTGSIPCGSTLVFDVELLSIG